MKNLMFYLLLVLVCSACSTMEFNTSGRELFTVAARSQSEKIVSAEVTKGFYFWGLTPTHADFDLQDEVEGQGISRPSYVTVEQKFKLSDILLTFVTLGLYCPVTYSITLLSNGEVK